MFTHIKSIRVFTAILSLQMLLTIPLAQAQEASDQLSPEMQSPYEYSFKFKDVPRHFALDVKETFWNKWTFAALVAGSGITVGLHSVDSEVKQSFSSKNRLGKAKDVFNTIGSPYVLGSGVLLSFGISRLVDSPKYKTTAETMLEAYVLAEVLTLGLKIAVRRTRPNGGSYSFPSGHASGAFAIATVLESLHGPKYGIPAYAISTMIGLSRLDDNKHFLTDVVSGLLLGTLVGYGTSKFHKKENANLFVAPMISANTAGVSLLKTF